MRHKKAHKRHPAFDCEEDFDHEDSTSAEEFLAPTYKRHGGRVAFRIYGSRILWDLSREDVSELTGISVNQLAKLEYGKIKPNHQEAKVLADVMDCYIDKSDLLVPGEADHIEVSPVLEWFVSVTEEAIREVQSFEPAIYNRFLAFLNDFRLHGPRQISWTYRYESGRKTYSRQPRTWWCQLNDRQPEVFILWQYGEGEKSQHILVYQIVRARVRSANAQEFARRKKHVVAAEEILAKERTVMGGRAACTLKIYRSKYGMSPHDVCEHMDMSVSEYAQLERGQVSLTESQTVELSKRLHCPIADLI